MEAKFIVIIVAAVAAALIIIILPPSILAAKRSSIPAYNAIRASATLSSMAVEGTVTFTQIEPPNGPTRVGVNIRLTTEETVERGIHVHTYGLTENNCLNAQGHYNPEDMNHGNRTGSPRHIGDLGNLRFVNGVSRETFEVENLPLGGPKSIIGRALVLHSLPDDLGQGDNQQSLVDGNSGLRIACAVITVVPNV